MDLEVGCTQTEKKKCTRTDFIMLSQFKSTWLPTLAWSPMGFLTVCQQPGVRGREWREGDYKRLLGHSSECMQSAQLPYLINDFTNIFACLI